MSSSGAVAAATERVYGTHPHQDDSDQRAIGTGATQHGGRWKATARQRSAGGGARLFRLRHRQQGDQERVRARQCAGARTAWVRPRLSRRRGGGRAAGGAGGAPGTLVGRFGGGCGGRAGLRSQRHAAVARRPGRWRRVPGLRRRQEVRQQRRARGGDIHPGGPRLPRRRRRPASRGADAGTRALSAACALWASAVRKPDRACRAVGPVRHPGAARPGARHRAGIRPAARRPQRARGVLPGRGAAQRGPDPDPARPRRDADAAAGLRRRRPLHRRAGAADRAGRTARRRPDLAGRPECRTAATGAPHRAAGSARPGGVPAPACRWRTGGGGRVLRAATQPLSLRPGLGTGAGGGGALAAGRRGRRRPARIGVASGGGIAAAPRLHQLRHARQGRQRRRLRAQHGQSVRHRPGAAGPGHPACGIARSGPATALCGGDHLERQHPCVPRRGRRLRPGGCADGGGGRDGECLAHRPADVGAGSRSRAAPTSSPAPATCPA